MEARPARPRWWILYLFCIFVLGLFFLEAKARLTEAGHTWAQLGLSLLLFGGGWIWLDLSRESLLAEERDKRRWELQRMIEPVYDSEMRKMHPEEGQNPSTDATEVRIPNRFLSWSKHLLNH